MNDLIVRNATSGYCSLEFLETIHARNKCDLQADVVSEPQRQLTDATCQRRSPVSGPQFVVVHKPSVSIVDLALSNRAIVFSILLFAGPIGLPALWFSRCFSLRAKIITTTVYFLITVALPLFAIWYFLEYSLQPMINVFNV